MKRRINRTFPAVSAFALALTITTNIALAQSAYPPDKVLTAQWWQWALSAPASGNPLLDTTGEFAAVNQRGRVWLLAGNAGGTTVRTVTVPAGKALFFPIVNFFDVEDGIAAGGVKVFFPFPVHQPVQTAQGIVSSVIATANGLSCEVDGSPLPIGPANLEQSTPFSLFLPADNLLGVPADVYFPAVDSGYYVLLTSVVLRTTHDPLCGQPHRLLTRCDLFPYRPIATCEEVPGL